MDLINALVSQAGISQTDAKGLAGGILGHVQTAMAGDEPEKARELEAAVPELEEWKAEAAQVPEAPAEGGGGLLGGLLGGGGAAALAGAVGGAEAKNALVLVQVLGRFGLEPGKATVVAPLLLQFLQKRLSPGTLSAAMTAAPFLMKFAGGDDKAAPAAAAAPEEGGGLGGLGGMLGGLLG